MKKKTKKTTKKIIIYSLLGIFTIGTPLSLWVAYSSIIKKIPPVPNEKSPTVPTTPVVPNEDEEKRKIAEIAKLQKELEELLTKTKQHNEQAEKFTIMFNDIKNKININNQEIQKITDLIKQKEEVLTNSKDEKEKKELQKELEKYKNELQTKEQQNKELIQQMKGLKEEELKQQELNTKNNVVEKSSIKDESLQDINKKIEKLTKSMSYNTGNIKFINELIENSKDEQEKEKLESYKLFLNGQSLGFEKLITNLKNELQALEKGKTYQQPKSNITFKDVFGMENEKKQLRRLINYFNKEKTPVNFENVDSKGFLLHGAPGTGKTYLIKALCNEAKVHFISFAPNDLDKKYVGEGNEVIEKIWQEAENHGKAIIFIDEIEGLANRNSKNTDMYAKNIVNNLLTRLDGFNRSDKKIILMGATNNLANLDPALESRFSKKIEFFPVTNEEIEPFLKHVIKPYHISFHTYCHLSEIAKRCQNHNDNPKNKKLSNRDLTTIINEAYNCFNDYYEENGNHDVMLPSDLDEALEEKLEIKKTEDEMLQNRFACEKQYEEWQKGIISKDKTIITKEYTFNRINYIEPILLPTDEFKNKDKGKLQVAEYVQHAPFNKWYYGYLQIFYPHFRKSVNDSLLCDVSEKSDFDVEISKEKHTITIKLNCPKYLLEKDKDYYIGDIQLPCNAFGGKSFFKLHFNPVQRALILYAKPHNFKE